MTDTAAKLDRPIPSSAGSDRRSALVKRRYRAEIWFKYTGLGAVLVSVAFLVFLLFTIVSGGLPAFTYHYMNLSVDLSQVDPQAPEKSDYDGPVRSGISQALPFLEGRKGRRLARSIVSGGSAIELRREVIGNPELAGEVRSIGVPVSDFADLYLKGLTAKPTVSNPQTAIKVSDKAGSVTIDAG
ncbi:MAG: DUF3333 domain-containing protein, partial [Pseudomonadota bacterium]